MSKITAWESVTRIGDAEFWRMPVDGLFIWCRARPNPDNPNAAELRYCWDGDGVVRKSLTETMHFANGGTIDGR